MSPYDEDLSPFENDPVFKALTGPASDSELSGEAAALAAFRTANGAMPHRRFAARLSAGGGVVVAVVALSGGVAAAAYSNALPSSVQNFAHTVAGPLGVPNKHISHHSKVVTQHPTGGSVHGGGPTSTGSSGAAGGPNPAPGASGSPSSTPSAHPKGKPAKAPTAKASPSVSATPTVNASPATSTTPTPIESTTPTPTPAVPAALSISVGQTRAPAGSSVSVVGAVSDGTGQPVADYGVSLLERIPGVSGTELLATSQSAADGSVQFSTPQLTQTVQLILRAGSDVRSAAVRVVVVPTISADVSQDGSTDQVSISVQGAQAGDPVNIYQREQGSWVLVQSVDLSGSLSADFTATPDPKQPVRYRAVLTATSAHAGASVGFVMPPAAPAQQ